MCSNMLGIRQVEALNWLTAQEPSGRWGLLRDMMEDKKKTKVCHIRNVSLPSGPAVIAF